MNALVSGLNEIKSKLYLKKINDLNLLHWSLFHVRDQNGRVERFQIFLLHRDSLTHTLGGAHADGYRVACVVE